MLSAKLIATVFGTTFILAGLLGFVPNPIVAPEGVFAVNAAHNLLHVVVGIAFLAGAWAGHARNSILALGITGVALTVLGFATSGDMLLGLVHVNQADRWLHALLAATILGAWWISTQSDVDLTSTKHAAK